MKSLGFIWLLLIFSCETRIEKLISLNEPPQFLARGEQVSIISDSFKLSQGSYPIVVELFDPNENISILTYELVAGSGSLLENGEMLTSNILSITMTTPILAYVPDTPGLHNLMFELEDSFNEKTTLALELMAFINLAPIAQVEIINPINSGILELVIDASKSFDQDGDFGGFIIDYEYTFLAKTLATSSDKQTIIFPSSGNYQVVVRVRDNDGEWSEPVGVRIEI